MSVRTPPFEIGSETEEINGVLRTIDRARVIRALDGRDEDVSPKHGLNLIARSELPDKSRIMTDVLNNSRIDVDVRRQAALLMARTNGEEAQPMLIRTLTDPDKRIRNAAAKGLAWIGNAEAYRPLVDQSRSSSATLAKQLSWAARVIAHRHGLAATELPELPMGRLVDFKSERRPVDVAPARVDRLELCLRSIVGRSFLLDASTSTGYELRCGKSQWMLLLTDEVLRDPEAVWSRRSLPAVAALLIEAEQSYSVALVALLEPQDGEVGKLMVCRSTGEPMFTGKVRKTNDVNAFSMRAVDRPGAYPLIFTGWIGKGELQVAEAFSGPVVVPKIQPVAIPAAS